MRVITIANQKGGIGKTTTATCVTSILNKRGYKVLLIDTDVQCNSTDTFKAETDGVATLYDLILDDDPCSVEEAIQHTSAGDIIAADPQLKQADLKLRDADAFFKLQEAISSLHGYDFVIIDTNPSVNTMLHNALVASNEVIIPITADRYAVQGLAQLTDTIATVKKRMNPEIVIGGLLMVKYNERTNLNKDVKAGLERKAIDIGSKLFKTYIRESTKLRESQTLRIPLIDYAPSCTTEQDYEAFVDELLQEEVI